MARPTDDLLRRLGVARGAVFEPAPGGASGEAWRVRDGARTYVLRLTGSLALTDARLAAMDAARGGGLPVPNVIRRVDGDQGSAVLLSWLPGETLFDALVRNVAEAPRWARLMGQWQRRLHEVSAPALLRTAAAGGRGAFDDPGDGQLPAGDALLHLDWHPLNLLVDPVTAELTGVVDWDNARRGHPALDLARTLTILTLDPGIAELPRHVRDALPAVVEAWAEGYGPSAYSIPANCRAWAAMVMLKDLAGRYADAPRRLDPVRRAIRAGRG